MPSPTKLAESPPRTYRGDDSDTRNHNQGSSSINHNSYSGRDAQSSPRHHNSHSPHKRYDNEIEPRSEPSQSHYQDSNRNRSRSPDTKQNGNRSHSGDRGNDSGKHWADSVDAPDNYEEEMQDGDREMMSATPNGPITRGHIPESGLREPVRERQFDENLVER